MYDSEIYDVEGRTYLQPTLSSGEQEAFIGALRDTVNRNTAQINRQTENLGTAVPSIQGGLTGSEGYFAQRYQTIPVETQTKTLKATAQAKALNDILSNYQAQYKNRVQQAARSAARRASGGGGGYLPDTSTDDYDEGDYLEEEPQAYSSQGQIGVQINENTPRNRILIAPDVSGYRYEYDKNTGKVTQTDDPAYAKKQGYVKKNGMYYLKDVLDQYIYERFKADGGLGL